MLQKRGLKVADLSRGYGRLEPNQTRKVSFDVDWRMFGDEPVMIARRNPKTIVCVGPSRLSAGHLAARDEPDVFILDDGFQHRQLARDLDLVLIDVTRPMPGVWSTHPFREHWGSLKRAHAVLLTRWDGEANLEPWIRQIKKIKADIPIIPLGFEKKELRFLDETPPQSVAILKGKKIAAWSGIAHPMAFFEDLRQTGADLVFTHALQDHQPLDEKTRDLIVSECRKQGISWVVTTEKDAVKLEKSIDSDIILSFLSINVKWMDNHQIESVLDLLPIKGLES